MSSLEFISASAVLFAGLLPFVALGPARISLSNMLILILLLISYLIPTLSCFVLRVDLFYDLSVLREYIAFLPRLSFIYAFFFLLYTLLLFVFYSNRRLSALCLASSRFFQVPRIQKPLYFFLLSSFLFCSFSIYFYYRHPPVVGPYGLDSTLPSFFDYVMLPWCVYVLFLSRSLYSLVYRSFFLFAPSFFLVLIPLQYGNRLQSLSILIATAYPLFSSPLIKNAALKASLLAFAGYLFLCVMSVLRDQRALTLSSLLMSMAGLSGQGYQSSNLSGSFFSSLQIVSYISVLPFWERFTDFALGVFIGVTSWTPTVNPYSYLRDHLGIVSPGGGLLPITAFFAGSFLLVALICVLFCISFPKFNRRSFGPPSSRGYSHFSALSLLTMSSLPRLLLYSPFLYLRMCALLLLFFVVLRLLYPSRPIC